MPLFYFLLMLIKSRFIFCFILLFFHILCYDVCKPKYTEGSYAEFFKK